MGLRRQSVRDYKTSFPLKVAIFDIVISSISATYSSFFLYWNRNKLGISEETFKAFNIFCLNIAVFLTNAKFIVALKVLFTLKKGPIDENEEEEELRHLRRHKWLVLWDKWSIIHILVLTTSCLLLLTDLYVGWQILLFLFMAEILFREYALFHLSKIIEFLSSPHKNPASPPPSLIYNFSTPHHFLPRGSAVPQVHHIGSQMGSLERKNDKIAICNETLPHVATFRTSHENLSENETIR